MNKEGRKERKRERRKEGREEGRKEGRTEGRKDGWEEGLVPPGTSYLLCERKEERCQRISESSG